MASNSSTPSTSDLKDSRWYFTAEQLAQSPSRKHGINADQELFYRQQTADLIQKMGQKLQVSQLCINTAIVYMHRFYAFHSFTHFHRNGIATASLFLAAKVEEQPRKLEHVIKVAHFFLGSDPPQATTEVYNEQAQDLVFNENVLLQTLGFDVAIDHPHTHVVKTCHLVKACKDLAQTSYFLASNSLHLTPMCLQYRPTVVACFCIYLACKWSRWEIPQSTEGKHWFHYVDSSVTMDLLKQLTDEFLAIYEKSPARLTSKLNSIEKFAQGARMGESTIPIPDSANGSSSQLSELQPARRPESYSSHHRRHSSSASSHHNHHSKQLPPNELGEHGKPPTSHKQPYTSSSGSHSTRPRPERPPIAAEGQFNVPSHGSTKQSVPPSVPRPSNSNRPPHGMQAPVAATNTTQRLPHAHDPNYHKNKSSIPPHVNPAVSGHKTLPKPGDPQRNVMKDATGRPIDPNKISNKHSSSSSTSNNSGNPSMFPAANAGATGIDMTRNVLQMQGSASIPQQQQQQQRPYTQSNSTQPPNYNQAISSRSSNNSSKYDQSVQQQMHLQSGQKQSLESSFSAANSRQIDDGNMKVEQMEICSPPKYPFSQVPPASVQQIPPPTSQSKSSSIFSPEWNEKGSHSSIPNINMKANNGSSSNSKFVGLTIKTSRDSPKKSDREKRSDTPKKDKNRSDQQLQDINKQYDKRGVSKKMDASGLSVNPQNIPVMPAYDVKTQQALNLSGMKRPNDGGNRIEDEREFKVRKIEPLSPPKMSDQRSYLFDQHSNDSRSMKSFPPTVNGIETDPDLVRNLLKESLCNESKFSSIKSEPHLDYVDMIKPIEPITDMETLPAQLLQNDSPKKEIKEEPVQLMGVEDFSKSKAEKKKKKDKHKHKEKDKSKDKEEKKKHKKDKDKHKERERSSGNELEQNHVKLTIPKEKLNLPMLDTNPPPSDLKIKIPKDRIRAELTNYQFDDIVNPIAPPQHNSLKIKISKDKIENYSHQQQTSSSHSIGNNYHSHSSKKKDRDRDKDREKEKKRSSSNSNEHNKQNGGGGVSESSSSSSSTKNQSSNSNKMQHYSSNMSQLFGDINDDDLQQHPSHHQQQRYSHSDKYNMQYHQQQMNHK